MVIACHIGLFVAATCEHSYSALPSTFVQLTGEYGMPRKPDNRVRRPRIRNAPGLEGPIPDRPGLCSQAGQD
jgi:hypothetical protein